MKKLIQRSILFVTLLSAIFVTVSFTLNKSSEKEVLLVQGILMGELSGVYIYHNDKPTEFIETVISEKMIVENGEIIKSTLQELYKNGWKLEATNGGDQVQRYILTK